MKKKTEKLLLGESAISFVLFTGINTSLIPFQEEKQVQLVIFTDGSLLIRIELFIVTGCTCLPSQEGNWLLPSL